MASVDTKVPSRRVRRLALSACAEPFTRAGGYMGGAHQTSALVHTQRLGGDVHIDGGGSRRRIARGWRGGLGRFLDGGGRGRNGRRRLRHHGASGRWRGDDRWRCGGRCRRGCWWRQRVDGGGYRRISLSQSGGTAKTEDHGYANRAKKTDSGGTQGEVHLEIIWVQSNFANYYVPPWGVRARISSFLVNDYDTASVLTDG